MNHIPVPQCSMPESEHSDVATMAAGSTFIGNHVLSMGQYSREDLELLYRTAEGIREERAVVAEERPLAGRLLMSAWRMSRRACALPVGGRVAAVTAPMSRRSGGVMGMVGDGGGC